MPECLDFWRRHLLEEKSQKQEEAPGLIWFQCRGDLPPGNSIFESVAFGSAN